MVTTNANTEAVGNGHLAVVKSPECVPVVSLIEQWNDAGEYHITALGRLGGYVDATLLLAQRWVAQDASGMRERAKYAPLALQGLVHSMMRARRVSNAKPLKRVVVQVCTSDNRIGRFEVDVTRATWVIDFSRWAFAEVHSLGVVRDSQGSEVRDGDGLDVDGVHGAAAGGGRAGDGVRAGAEREGMGGAHPQARREAGAHGGDGDARAAGTEQAREAEPV